MATRSSALVRSRASSCAATLLPPPPGSGGDGRRRPAHCAKSSASGDRRNRRSCTQEVSGWPLVWARRSGQAMERQAGFSQQAQAPQRLLQRTCIQGRQRAYCATIQVVASIAVPVRPASSSGCWRVAPGAGSPSWGASSTRPPASSRPMAPGCCMAAPSASSATSLLPCSSSRRLTSARHPSSPRSLWARGWQCAATASA